MISGNSRAGMLAEKTSPVVAEDARVTRGEYIANVDRQDSASAAAEEELREARWDTSICIGVLRGYERALVTATRP